jgi:Flp pilus assembly protein TadB
MDKMKRRNRYGVWLVGALVVGMASSIPVWREYRHQKEQTRLAKIATLETETTKAKWLEQKARQSDPASREELVRAQGYLKPGEKRVEMLK